MIGKEGADNTMRYFEDFRRGDTFDLGTHRVLEDEIIDFARQFDPQPFHIDPEWAIDSFFGGLVASGWYSTALCMRLLVTGLLNDAAYSSVYPPRTVPPLGSCGTPARRSTK